MLNIVTPDSHPYSGYGRMSLELLYHISKMGHRVNVLGDDWHDYLHLVSPEVQELLKKPIAPTFGGIALGYPTLYREFGGPLLFSGPVLAATMFESTVLPQGWVQVLNECKAVSVPAQFLVKVFKANGVHVPVKCIPIGVSENFQYVKRPYRKPFTFLAIGDRGIRKGWDVAVQAFLKAFGNNPDFRLIIKTREGEMGEISRFTNPTIEILRADYTEQQLMELYERCDAMVFPTRGDGFGLPPREFARTGGPVIATNWGGTADDLPGWGFPLRYQLVKAWAGHPTMDGLGKWAEPDVEHLTQQMQYVASEKRWELWANPHRTPTRMVMEAQSVRVAQKIRKLYTWENFAVRMLESWQQVSQPAPAPVGDRRKRRLKKGA